jgi:hypothetical protein
MALVPKTVREKGKPELMDEGHWNLLNEYLSYLCTYHEKC